MRVLALSSYPTNAAATRFRVEQFMSLLAKRGIYIDPAPFLSTSQFAGLYHGGILKGLRGMAKSIARRIRQVSFVSDYDLLLVQREAMPFGPAIFERVY